MLTKIFVYGTLMEDFRNYNKYLKDYVVKVEKAYVLGDLYHLIDYDCPVIVKGNQKVYGELIQFEDDEKGSVLNSVDELEHSFENSKEVTYNRMEAKVFLEDRVELATAYYFANKQFFEKYKDRIEYIKDGNWRKYANDRCLN